jgi:lipoprotein NlpI
MLRDKLLIIIIAILMTLTLSTGCSNQNKGDKNAKKIKKVKIEKTPAEKEQAELLRKVSRDFEDADAHYRLGYLHQQNGLWAKAQYEYSTALNFDPINRQAQAGLVKVLTNMGDTAKSQVYADIYMNQAASNASGSLKLALAFQQQKLDDYALRCYQN